MKKESIKKLLEGMIRNEVKKQLEIKLPILINEMLNEKLEDMSLLSENISTPVKKDKRSSASPLPRKINNSAKARTINETIKVAAQTMKLPPKVSGGNIDAIRDVLLETAQNWTPRPDPISGAGTGDSVLDNLMSPPPVSAPEIIEENAAVKIDMEGLAERFQRMKSHKATSVNYNILEEPIEKIK